MKQHLPLDIGTVVLEIMRYGSENLYHRPWNTQVLINHQDSNLGQLRPSPKLFLSHQGCSLEILKDTVLLPV